MSTHVLRAGRSPAPPAARRSVNARRNDRYFFLAMTVVILVSVFVGFARTYYLAGWFRAPLPNRLIHIHGAAFTAWLVVLLLQTSLVSAGRVDLHRRLGLFGFALAAVMVVLGVAAGTDLMRRDSLLSAFNAQAFYAGTIGDMVIFGTLIYFAFRLRRNPAAHKRLVLIATLTLMEAAVGRWPLAIALIDRHPIMLMVLAHSFLIPLVAYDLSTLRKLHPATLWGGLFLVVGQFLEPVVGKTALWQGFAAQVLTHIR